MQHDDLERLIARRQWLRNLAAMAMAGGAVGIAEAVGPLVPKFRRTRAGTLPCIPKRYNYATQKRSPSIIAQSQSALLLTSSANDLRIAGAVAGDISAATAQTDSRRRKRLRPNRAQLRIDHCRVSDIVLDVEKTGIWAMSLLAEQNPPLEPEQDLRFRQRLHLRRNQFVIEVRLLAATTSSFADVVESDVKSREPDPGRLIVAIIQPAPFWVQREEPRNMRWTGYNGEIKNSFEEVAAAEFEYYYRLDPLSAAGENVRRLDDT